MSWFIRTGIGLKCKIIITQIAEIWICWSLEDIAPCTLYVSRRCGGSYSGRKNYSEKQVISFSETSVHIRTIWRCIPEDCNIHTNLRLHPVLANREHTVYFPVAFQIIHMLTFMRHVNAAQFIVSVIRDYLIAELSSDHYIRFICGSITQSRIEPSNIM
jgi:hypothetical protein